MLTMLKWIILWLWMGFYTLEARPTSSLSRIQNAFTKPVKKMAHIINKMTCSCPWISKIKSKREKKVSIDDLPSEITSLILNELQSTKDVASCSLVCSRWRNIVSSDIVDFSRYSSEQDFLRRAWEGHLDGTKTQQAKSISLFVQSPLGKNMCWASEYFLIRAAAKFGQISVLDQYLDAKKQKLDKNRISDMFNAVCVGENWHNFDKDLQSSDNVIHWCWEKTQALDEDQGKHSIQWHILAQAIYRGMSSLINATSLPLLNSDQILPEYFLVAAAQSVRPSKFTLVTLLKGLVKHHLATFTVPPERRHYMNPLDGVCKGFATCSHCQSQDLNDLIKVLKHHPLEQGAPFNEDDFITRTMSLACMEGNVNAAKLLVEHAKSSGKQLATSKNVESAIQSGSVPLVQYLLKQNPELVLSWNSFKTSFALEPVNTNFLNHYLLHQKPDWKTIPIDRLKRVYLRNACGNKEDLAAFKLVLQHSSPLNEGDFEMAISRNDFPEAGSHLCRYNESLQLIEYILQEKKIQPTLVHVKAALRRGRLDIFKLIVEHGEKLGSPFEFKENMLTALMKSDPRESFQEPSLISYIVDRMKQPISKKVWNHFLHVKPDAYGKEQLDCYQNYIKSKII